MSLFAAYRQEAVDRKHKAGLTIVARVAALPVADRIKVLACLEKWAADYLEFLGEVEVTYPRTFWQRRFRNLTKFFKAQLQFLAS